MRGADCLQGQSAERFPLYSRSVSPSGSTDRSVKGLDESPFSLHNLIELGERRIGSRSFD